MDPMTTPTTAFDTLYRRAGRSTHGMYPQEVPRGLFVAEVLARGYAHIAHDSFAGVAPANELARIAAPVLIHADRDGEVVEAVLRYPGGELVYVDAGFGKVEIEVAAASHETAAAKLVAVRDALEREQSTEERIKVAFWMQSTRGGAVRRREIEAPSLSQIAGNYAAGVRDALERLVGLRAPERGRLILWRGEPGTGKSHALRALAREWSSWCEAHFIMDPQDLFGRGGAYMLDVLTWSKDEEAWRLLVLEDAGELIAAGTAHSQALSRLLNVADGVLGQGTRTLVLITTNEPLKALHPATRRPGRCLADIEFAELSVEEANAWLERRGIDRRVSAPTPVAELYGAEPAGEVLRDELGPSAPPFGFGRALALDRD